MSSTPLSETLRETLDVFEIAGRGTPLTTPELAERLDLGRRSTYERLERLVDSSPLETKKVGANARVWWLPPNGRSDHGHDDRSTGDHEAVDEVIDGVDVGIFVLDENFDVAWINRAAEEYFGLDQGLVVGRDKRRLVESRIAPVVEDSERFAETVLATYDDNTKPERFECHVLGSDDRRERWLEHWSKPIESGEYAGGRVEIYYDVTERRQSQRARHEEREQFHSLVDAVEEYAIAMLDADGRVQTWNSGAERIKGFERERVLGEYVGTLYTEADRADGVPAANLAAAERDGTVEEEGWRVRADGSRFWANVTITAIRDDAGDLQGYAKVTRDMTDRRERERQLRRERDLTDRLLETAPVRLAIFRPDGFVERINSQSKRQTGVVEIDQEEIRLEDLELYDADGEPYSAADHPVSTVVETGESVSDWVAKHDGPDGEERWVSITATPMEDEDGELERIVVAGKDVTELKRKERELARRRDELERELDDVFTRIDDGMFGLDDEYRFTYVNDRGAEILGEDPGELVGRQFVDVFPDVVDTEFERETFLAWQEGESRTFEEYYEPLDAWFSAAIYPSDSGVSVYFRNVTDRKERERELELYERIVETVDDGIYAVDENARFVLVNDAFCELTGYDRDELLGEHATTVHAKQVTPKVEAMADEVASGDRDRVKIELDVQTGDGSEVPCESRVVPYSLDGEEPAGRCGVVRDISDHLDRERELRNRVTQQRVVTELGQRALSSHDVDDLIDEAVTRVAETLDVAYAKVLELDEDGQELLLRGGIGWEDDVVGETTLSTSEERSQAAYTLGRSEPVVVDDLTAETRFDGPRLLTDHGVESGISTVVGPADDPWGVFGAHHTESREFSAHDVNFVRSVANILASALKRHRDEEELVQQREHLAALNDVNGVVQDITEAVVEQSTREEIEATVCERLADADSYEFAWIGGVDAASETVTLRTEAGVEGYLDGVTVSVDPENPYSAGPTGQAVIHRAVRTANDVRNGGQHAAWRDHLDQYDFRSSAAIPILHDGTLYGVLNVYAPRPGAFEGQERDVIEQLGEVVGHAIASVERKAALTSDQVVEVEFAIDGVFDALDVPASPDGRITLDQTVAVDDDTFLGYGTVTGDALDYFEQLVASVPQFDSLATFDGGGDRTRYELRLSNPPVVEAVTASNGYVKEAFIEDGDYRTTIHLPPSVDTRRLFDTVQESYPTAKLVAQRQITRERRSVQRLEQVLVDDLSDRQRTALKSAYFSGYFDWPRDKSGEEVASTLGVSSPTFHQHLRKAEKTLVGRVLSEDDA